MTDQEDPNSRWRVDPGRLAEPVPGFRVREADVTDPAGRRHRRAYLQTPEAVVVVAVEDDRLIMIREFRPAVGGAVLQLPMGKVDAGATPRQAAAAELAEETGYAAAELRIAGVLLTAPAWMNQRSSVFHATGVSPIAGDRPVGDPDDVEEEYLQVDRVPLEAVGDLVSSGAIQDARCIAAVALVLGMPPGHG